jgi:predicted MFS family arabinose efflux permease
METLILGWYVLVETGSVLMLTVFAALQYLGTLIAPMFGVVGDRIGHRTLLCGLRTIYAGLATLLMALAFARMLNPLVVLCIAAMGGIVRPSDQGLRGAIVAETVPADQLGSAMGISRTTTDSARVAGAIAGAGLFAALGMGPAYVAVASLYVLGLLFSLGIARSSASPTLGSAADSTVRLSAWGDLREGITYVWTTPHLLAAMCLAFLANLAAFPLLTGMLPYVARDIFRTDQTGLGYLAASAAAGALLGSVALSLISAWARPGRMMLVFAGVWFMLVLLFGQMQSIAGGITILFLAGSAQALSMVPLSVMLLRTSNEKFRGRVMGVRMLAIYGLPLGLLAGGALIDLVGFRVTTALYAVTGLLFTLLIAIRWRAHLWSLEAPANTR